MRNVCLCLVDAEGGGADGTGVGESTDGFVEGFADEKKEFAAEKKHMHDVCKYRDGTTKSKQMRGKKECKSGIYVKAGCFWDMSKPGGGACHFTDHGNDQGDDNHGQSHGLPVSQPVQGSAQGSVRHPVGACACIDEKPKLQKSAQYNPKTGTLVCNAHCAKDMHIPPGKYEYPLDYGSSICKEHDKSRGPCKFLNNSIAEPFCTEHWCYVDKSCPSAHKSKMFNKMSTVAGLHPSRSADAASVEGAGVSMELYYSYLACGSPHGVSHWNNRQA